MRLLLVLGLCFAVGILPVFAQTPLPTATPELNQAWTLAPSVNPEGTPVPAHDVVFTWQINVGDVLITTLAAVVLFEVSAIFVFWYVITRRGKT